MYLKGDLVEMLLAFSSLRFLWELKIFMGPDTDLFSQAQSWEERFQETREWVASQL